VVCEATVARIPPYAAPVAAAFRGPGAEARPADSGPHHRTGPPPQAWIAVNVGRTGRPRALYICLGLDQEALARPASRRNRELAYFLVVAALKLIEAPHAP